MTHPFFAEAVVDRDATAAMVEAYDNACRSMCEWGQPDIIKETIAKQIIEVAPKRERDPDQLCDRALKKLGFNERITRPGA